MTITKQSREIIHAFLESQGAEGSNLEAARILIRNKANSHFWYFQRYVYGNKDTDTTLHHDLCNRWQRRHRCNFTLWLISRFHLKTSCISEAGTLWEFVNDPHHRTLLINAKLELAEAILANITMCAETNEIFRWLYPEYCIDLVDKHIRRQCKWGVQRIDFPCSNYRGKREGCIEVMGVEASLVSRHYDILRYDDPVNDINTATKPYRNKIHRWFKNSLQLRHDTRSKIELIGTRWDFDDLYGRLIKKERAHRKKMQDGGEKVIPRLWIYHRQVVEKLEEGGETIAGYDNVRPIWPERFSKQDIDEIREDVGSYVFGCQFMNSPVSEEDAIFKYKDIKFIDEYLIPDNVINFIATDTAVEEVEDGDFWVITVGSFDDKGNMYVRKIVRDKLVTSSYLDHVIELTKQWDAQLVGIETTVFQKTIAKNYREAAIERGANIPWVEMNRARSGKRKRHFSLQPRVERGQFFIQEGIDNADYCVEEMITCPRPVYDDILDTLADLEFLFFKAPNEVEKKISKNTYEGFYGRIDGEEDDEPSMSCSIIDDEELVA